MIQKFQKHIQDNFSNILNQRIIVAISGGIDSVVLAFLFKRIGVSVVLAHCNFQLRGQESQDDEQFVLDFAQKYDFPLEIIRFDTTKYASDNQLNKQLAARELRYQWFEQLAQQQQCQYIATAHHAHDNLETFFINLFRGTGIKGLLGIPSHNQNIIRPMLIFSREEIIQFAQYQKLTWREDSSNASDDYVRNYIRHHIVPELHKIHPNFLQNFQLTQRFIGQTQQFVSSQIEQFRKKYQKQEQDIISLQIDEIRQNPNKDFIIFELMKPFGFSNILDLNRLLQAQSGKQLFSSTHRVVKHRTQWLISPIVCQEEIFYEIPWGTTQIKTPLHLIFSQEKYEFQTDKNTIFIKCKNVPFPLKIRKWQPNDIFAPEGMGGKKKKVSKFFKDEKYSVLDKENQWILTSYDNQIIWIIGKRLDQRFKADNSSDEVLKITQI